MVTGPKQATWNAESEQSKPEETTRSGERSDEEKDEDSDSSRDDGGDKMRLVGGHHLL